MKTKQKIKITLIDENELFREGMNRILEDTDLFKIVFTSRNIIELMTSPTFQTDIIIMDQEVYDCHCLQQINDIRKRFPLAKLVLFITDAEKYPFKKAIDLGILGYLTKEIDINSLISALKTVYYEQYWISPDLSHHLVLTHQQSEKKRQEEQKQTDRITPPLHLLSTRENQVLQLLGSGYNNQAIANTLNVTQSTVKNHVTNIFVKINVNDRTQAVIKAIKNHWIDIYHDPLEKLGS